MNWSRCAGEAAEPEHRAGFTTLAVPFFFTMLFAAWLIAGPIALLAAPVIFRLALVVVPAPSRLRPPSCPNMIRCEAEQAAGAARRAAQRAARRAAQTAPTVHEVIRSTAPAVAAPTTPAAPALVVAVPAPATSADARRVEAPRRRAA